MKGFIKNWGYYAMQSLQQSEKVMANNHMILITFFMILTISDNIIFLHLKEYIRAGICHSHF